MSKVLEIRWHGRGGQGAQTAALMLAEVAGKWISMSKVSEFVQREWSTDACI